MPHYPHLCEHACMLSTSRPIRKTKHILQASASTHRGIYIQSQNSACGTAPGEEPVLFCLQTPPAFRPPSWCTLELCIHPICIASFSLCSTVQPSPQLLPGNSLTVPLTGIYRNARQFLLTCFQTEELAQKVVEHRHWNSLGLCLRCTRWTNEEEWWNLSSSCFPCLHLEEELL